MPPRAKDLLLPDTKLVEESLDAVRPILSPAFLNHSVRTFLRGKTRDHAFSSLTLRGDGVRDGRQ